MWRWGYWHSLKKQPTILSLSEEIDEGEGNSIELWETLADNSAMHLDVWIDARTWLAGCPKRLVDIAYEKVSGQPHGSIVDSTVWNHVAWALLRPYLNYFGFQPGFLLNKNHIRQSIYYFQREAKTPCRDKSVSPAAV